MSFKPQLIEGGKGGNFPCTYCAQGFRTREALDDHWDSDPRCGRNRNVSSNSPQKGGNAEDVDNPVMPGEYVLGLVRSHEGED